MKLCLRRQVGLVLLVALVVTSGAGAASRRSLGTVVLGGQLAATIIAVVLVPVYFVVFPRLSDRFAKPEAGDQGVRPSRG